MKKKFKHEGLLKDEQVAEIIQNTPVVMSESAKTVLERRYLRRDDKRKIIETPEELFYRVAENIASVELQYNKDINVASFVESYYKMMASFDFLPNSPCLMNAGTPLQMLFGCFVLPVYDSMGDIFNAIRYTSLIHQAGGGTGFNFSRLRQEGSLVKTTNSVASGPISFMAVFNEATEAILQGGKRRGANLGILDITHPDIFKFIKCKEDLTKLNNFNISVALTDDFMEAVKSDGSFFLIDPQTKKPVKEVRARELFDMLVQQAWKTAEPGVIFIDKINQYNPLPGLGRINACNPCLRKSAKLLTKNGIRELKDIDIGTDIWSSEGWTKIINKTSSGVKEVFGYDTTSGVFYSTSNHKIVSDGKKIEVGVAETIDLSIYEEDSKQLTFDSQTIMDGLVWGDGMMHKASNNLILLCIGSRDNDYFTSEIAHLIKKERKGVSPYVWEVETTITTLDRTWDRCIPQNIMFGDEKLVRSFLRGVYSANGSVINTKGRSRVTLKLTSKRAVEEIQLLLSSLGIYSYFTTNKPSKIMFSNGEYICKESYDINISSVSVINFAKKIGFIQKYKIDKISISEYTKGNKTSAIIREQKYIGNEEVFDITVDNKTHTFWCYGFNTGNCGEQPLHEFASCCLGSINVSNFAKDNTVDYDRLTGCVWNAVRFLDSLIDANKYLISEIEEMTKANRQIGLGIMGWADLLCTLKIPYDSNEAIELAEQLMSFINTEAHKASESLGKEKGLFPNYDKSLLKQRGREERNSAVTTIAPTGSIGMIASASGGIEPLFAVFYTKNVMDNDKLAILNPVFENVCKERGILSPELISKIIKVGNIQSLSEIPDDIKRAFVTAQDISSEAHVNMQATFQKYVDNAISKTVNLPTTATEEDVKNVYLLAYDLGCKGITVYRDGSRPDQVIQTKEDKKDSKQTKRRVRGEIVNGKTHKVKTGCGKLYVTVNCDDYGIIEVFAQMGKGGGCSASQNETIGRLISVALRDGVDVNKVIKQLSGIRCPSPAWESDGKQILSCGDAIAYALKKTLEANPIIKEPETAQVQKQVATCPECGASIIYESGCVSCHYCGYSRC